MRNSLPIPILLLFATPVVAQEPPQSRELRDAPGADPMRTFSAEETVDREAFEAAVKAVFEEGDRDGDGELTLAEVDARTRDNREAEVAQRFARIDSDDDGKIALAEFAAWEFQAHRAPPPPFAVPLKSSEASGDPIVAHGRGIGGHVIDLGMAGEPFGAATLVAADVNRDGALTLAELLAYQGARFEAADRDRDGEISPDEFPVPRHAPAQPRSPVRVRAGH